MKGPEFKLTSLEGHSNYLIAYYNTIKNKSHVFTPDIIDHLCELL